MCKFFIQNSYLFEELKMQSEKRKYYKECEELKCL